MGSTRLVVAALLLAISVAAAGAAYVSLRGGDPGASGTYGIDVIGPDGALFSGEVVVENATALSVLLVAADRAGFDVELEDYPGMGTYVRAIGGHRAHGATGWVYEIWRDGAWTSGERSAAWQPLEEGDALRWKWTDA